MKKRRSIYLSPMVVNQYPLEELKELIFATLDIVENYLISLNYDNVLDLTSHNKYKELIGGFAKGFNPNKIISLIIKVNETKSKMEDFLNSYYYAIQTLEPLEREVFIYSFIKRYDSLEILEKLKLHSVQLTEIRKSAIVRFSLRLGLDKLL